MGACNACGAKGQDELTEFKFEAANKGEGVSGNAVNSPTGGSKDPAATTASKSPKKGERQRELAEQAQQQPPAQEAQPEPSPEESPGASTPAAEAPAVEAPAPAPAAPAAESEVEAVPFAKLPSVGAWLAPRPSSTWLAALAAAKVPGAEDASADAEVLVGELFEMDADVADAFDIQKPHVTEHAAEVLALDESPSKLDAQLAAKFAALLAENLIGEPKALEEVHSTDQCAVLFEDNAAKAQVAEAAPEADEILSDPIKKDKLAPAAPTKRPWTRLPSVGTWVSGAYHPTLLRDAAAPQELSNIGAKAEA